MNKIPAILLFFLLAAPGLRAQNSPAPVTQIALGHSVVALTGPWKFHIGDNPKWADPNFDDSGWETVNLKVKQGSVDPMMGFAGFVPGWTAKGHPGYYGYAWYRIRVRITGADEPLALLPPQNVDDGYQLFANGRLIGSFGNFDGPVPALYISRPVMFDLPVDSVTPGGNRSKNGTLVLAFRFYMTPASLLQSMSGGLHGPPVLGFSNGITAAYHVAWENLYRASSPLFVEIGWLLVFAVLTFMLYLFDRSETILLWALVACLVEASTYLILALSATSDLMNMLQRLIALSIAIPIAQGLWLITWRAYFDLRKKKWLRNAICALVLYAVTVNLFFNILLTVGKASHATFALYTITGVAVNTAVMALAVVIACLAWGRPHREHWALFLTLFFFALSESTTLFQTLHLPIRWFPFGLPITLVEFGEVAMLACFSVVLLRRFRSSQRRQQAMEEEVAQAQQVQQVLIPEELPHVPGLTIESEYRPASEVGGDFFQIIPNSANGSVLIVAGDVTGHGLQAGMMVALIVGAIRSTAQFDSDPLRMLKALNQRLWGHAHATCLAMRIAADGEVTLANAGHMPPYWNGKEYPMEGALPLGIMEGAEFPVMHFQLAPGDVLMLLSDGVAEAQDAQGHLFGFERIEAMLRQPITAAEVAAAAKEFGQQDDISVMRVVREARVTERTSVEPALAAG